MKLQKTWYGIITEDEFGFKELLLDCDEVGPQLYKTQKEAKLEGKSLVKWGDPNSKGEEIKKAKTIKLSVQIMS